MKSMKGFLSTVFWHDRPPVLPIEPAQILGVPFEESSGFSCCRLQCSVLSYQWNQSSYAGSSCAGWHQWLGPWGLIDISTCAHTMDWWSCCSICSSVLPQMWKHTKHCRQSKKFSKNSSMRLLSYGSQRRIWISENSPKRNRFMSLT